MKELKEVELKFNNSADWVRLKVKSMREEAEKISSLSPEDKYVKSSIILRNMTELEEISSATLCTRYFRLQRDLRPQEDPRRCFSDSDDKTFDSLFKKEISEKYLADENFLSMFGETDYKAPEFRTEVKKNLNEGMRKAGNYKAEILNSLWLSHDIVSALIEKIPNFSVVEMLRIDCREALKKISEVYHAGISGFKKESVSDEQAAENFYNTMKNFYEYVQKDLNNRRMHLFKSSDGRTAPPNSPSFMNSFEGFPERQDRIEEYLREAENFFRMSEEILKDISDETEKNYKQLSENFFKVKKFNLTLKNIHEELNKIQTESEKQINEYFDLLMEAHKQPELRESDGLGESIGYLFQKKFAADLSVKILPRLHNFMKELFFFAQDVLGKDSQHMKAFFVMDIFKVKDIYEASIQLLNETERKILGGTTLLADPYSPEANQKVVIIATESRKESSANIRRRLECQWEQFRENQNSIEFPNHKFTGLNRDEYYWSYDRSRCKRYFDARNEAAIDIYNIFSYLCKLQSDKLSAGQDRSHGNYYYVSSDPESWSSFYIGRDMLGDMMIKVYSSFLSAHLLASKKSEPVEYKTDVELDFLKTDVKIPELSESVQPKTTEIAGAAAESATADSESSAPKEAIDDLIIASHL